MATKITASNTINALSGSPEKRLDMDPNGVLWAAICQNPSLVKFFYSRNGGATWAYASGSDINHGQSTNTPSLFIDKDGFAHCAWVVWDADPQVVRYARGVPTGTGTSTPGWKWTYLTISPANARLDTDADVVVHRSGAGWTAWVAYSQGSASGMKVAQVGITSTGLLSVKNAQHGPNSGGVAYQRGSLEFAHTGDGRTPSASPDLFLTTIVGGGNTGSVRLNKATYSGATWTWQVPVTLPSAYEYNSLLSTVWDGNRLYAAYVTSGGVLVMYEWSGSGAATSRNPPSLPAAHAPNAEMASVALSHDPVTDDIFLAWQDLPNPDIYYARFVRTTLTWTAWTKAASVTAIAGDGKIALVKHPNRDSVDMAYGSVVVDTPNWTIYSQQLVALQRTPVAPTLRIPASGAKSDLSTGATFAWTYNKVSPGDSQQAWVFRRTNGAVTEYWNYTARLWTTTLVVNTTNGSAQEVSFPPGVWDTGKTYSWSVRVRSSTGNDSVFATDRTVISTAAPVVVVTDPQGIVYGESTPLVAWTYTSSDPQRDYEIRVLADADGISDTNPGGGLWTSGIVTSSGARTARVGIPLANGGAYRVYVRATSSTGVSSDWDYSQFGIQITPPDGPVVELLDEISDTGVVSVRLDIQAQTSFLSAAQDDGSGGWVADANATVAAVAANLSTQVFQGFSMTSITDGLMGVVTDVGSPPLAPFGEAQPTGPLSFPVVPGQPYTGLASVRAMNTTRAARIRIRWYDADDGSGNLLGSDVGEQVSATNLNYNQAVVTAVAPVGAVLARVLVEVLGATAGGEGFWVSFPSFHPGRRTGYQPGGLSTTQAVQVQRSDDGGATWKVVVERVKTSLAQQATAYDRTMPLGVDTWYQAFTLSDFGDGSLLASEASPAATIAVQSPAWTIRDLQDETGEMLAYVVGHDRTDDESSSVHWPAGRVYPIVDTEGPQSSTGTLSIFVKQDDLATAIDVLRRTTPMIIQSPSGEVFLARLIRRKYAVEASRHKVIDVDYIEVDSEG